MKRFLVLFVVFSTCVILITAGTIGIVKSLIANGHYFSIDKKVHYLFLGDSQFECAFNDSLIGHSQNISNSGEAYLYRYFKATKLADNNPQLQVVFIVFSNNSIAAWGDKWVWDDNFMNGHYVKYAPLLTKEEYQILLPKKTKTILNLESVSLLKNIQFLAGKESSYISYSKWGKYLPNVKSNMDSLLRLPAKNDSLYSSGELSDISISYLEKTVAHLKNKQIKVVLVRTPLHPLSLTLKNESSIQHFRKERLSDVDFIDFKDFPSDNNDRADYMHLNYRGARKFSIFFNNLLQQGLLDSVDKQAFINRQMELLKKSEDDR